MLLTKIMIMARFDKKLCKVWSLFFLKYGLKIGNIKLTLVKGIPKLGIRIMKLKLARTM